MANYWKRLARWSIPAGVASLLLPLLLGHFSLTTTPSASEKTATPQTWNTPPNIEKHLLTRDRQSPPLVYGPPEPNLWTQNGASKPQPGALQTKTQIYPKSSPQPTTAVTAQEHLTSPQPKSAKPPLKKTKPQNTPAVTVRVAVATNADSLIVGTSTTAVVVDDQGRLIGKILASEAAIAHSDGEAIQLGDWETPTSLWVQSTGSGVVYVGNRWYRGVVRLIQEGDRLLAVNYVEMEDYLKSVVGSEMPSHWPLEALKAQAVAARSYALVHIIRPAHTHYDLGATPRWQAYKGLQAESNISHAAVEATRGLFLSYQGGVVESLYAASDELVVQAHGGAGMSQQGAYELSQQRYNYLHILSAYYPNTQLAQIQISQ